MDECTLGCEPSQFSEWTAKLDSAPWRVAWLEPSQDNLPRGPRQGSQHTSKKHLVAYSREDVIRWLCANHRDELEVLMRTASIDQAPRVNKRRRTERSTDPSPNDTQSALGNRSLHPTSRPAARDHRPSNQRRVQTTPAGDGQCIARQSQYSQEADQDSGEEGEDSPDGEDADGYTTKERQSDGDGNSEAYTWLWAQTGCDELPRTKVKAMVKKAALVCDWRTMENWKAVLAYWRSTGGLTLPTDTAISLSSLLVTFASAQSTDPRLRTPTLSSPEATDLGTAMDGFRAAFLATGGVQAMTALQDVVYRYMLANLHRWYRNVDSLIPLGTESNAGMRGVGRQTYVKARLFSALHGRDGPEWTDSVMVHVRPGTSDKEWRSFGKRLEKARRWFNLQERFGGSIFACMPSGLIHHTWVERLRSDHFVAWMDMIEKFNPRVRVLNTRFAELLQAALGGQPPPRAKLGLEYVDKPTLQALSTQQMVEMLCIDGGDDESSTSEFNIS